jgi:hypothetical protein
MRGWVTRAIKTKPPTTSPMRADHPENNLKAINNLKKISVECFHSKAAAVTKML